jgi:alpha/beta superfamily hydrolase
MGACASRPSDDGASTSGSSKKSKAGKPGSVASTNPARVLNLGADAESYFARSGGRAFYASPPVSATDSVPRESLPRDAVEQAVTFESKDGTPLAGVVHRPYDDDEGSAKDPPGARGRRGGRVRRQPTATAAFDDIATVESPSSPYDSRNVSRRQNVGRGRNEAARDDRLVDGASPLSRLSSAARGAGVALCHPHPFLGGDKDSALVVALARRLARAGVTVLRFDSRGVGESGGKRTWMRDAEREDCEAAVRRVAKTRGVDKNRVYAIGYGLGAAVALEASKREPSARGFVGISYPFGAKSMLVPCAVGEKAFSLENASPSKKPRLFAVAGNDCVGVAGDCDAVAASVRKLPPPRRVVVVDDADHAWCGFYETLTTHVLEFMEEHAETLRAEKKREADKSLSSSSETETSDGDVGGAGKKGDVPFADRRRYAPNEPELEPGESLSGESLSKSSSLEEFGARMSENEDTDDSGGARFGGFGSRRARRDADPSARLAVPRSRGERDRARRDRASSPAASSLDGTRDERGASSGDEKNGRRARDDPEPRDATDLRLDAVDATDASEPVRGWTSETVKASSDPAEALGWEREVRARARGAATAGGRPLGPLSHGTRSSPLRSRRHSAPSSDDGQSSVGAYGDGAGGFETWEAWEEEKRRRAKMGSPGHTPAASRGSTPWQTPGHSPGHTPLGPRSVAGDDGAEDVVDNYFPVDPVDPVNPWALNGAPPLIRSAEDVAAKAAAKLAAMREEETERKSDGSDRSRSDVSASAASRASNRRLPTPMPVATIVPGGDGSQKERISRSGSRDGLAAPFPQNSPRLGSPSGSRAGSTVGSAAPARPILKHTSSYGNLNASVGSGNSREGSQHGPDPNEPSLLMAFKNASTKLHGRPNLFRSGIRAVLAANRFVAAGQKRVQWEETTAEGRPIIDAVHRKPTRVGNRMRSAAKAVMAGNRLASFDGAAASPLRGQFLQKSVVEEREWARHNKIADVRRRVSESHERSRSRGENHDRTQGGSRASSDLSRGSGSSRDEKKNTRADKPRFSAAARAVVAGYRVRQFGAGASGAGAGAGAGARESARSSSRSRSPSTGSRSPSVSRSGSPSRRRGYEYSVGGGASDGAGGVFAERRSGTGPAPGPGSPGAGRRLTLPPRGSPSSSLRSSRGETGVDKRSRSRSGF